MDDRTALYRHYNRDGELLYVGISASAAKRLRQHIDGSCWRYEITRIDVEWLDSRADALAAEKAAIVAERPIFNTLHSPRIKRESQARRASISSIQLPMDELKDAPAEVVEGCMSPAQALAVSILAGNHKLDYIAACIGKSRSYVSRMQTGSAPIPDRLIGPLCAATGSNLLRQHQALQRALMGQSVAERLAELLRAAA